MWAVPIGFCFPILLAGTCMQHLYEGACIKVWNSFLIWIFKTEPYPILEPSTELNPARISFFSLGAKEMSPPAQSFFGILLNGSILPSRLFEQLILRSPHQELPGDDRGSNPPAVAGRLFFHNKTWTIIPTLGSLRVYVHPWLGTVSFRFIPCSRYPNSRKCVHTPQTDLTRNPFSRTNTTPTHT